MEKNFYYRGHCIHRSNDDLKALVSINVWCVVLDGQIKLHIVVAYKDFNFMWWVKCSKFGILGSFGSFISRENSNAGWNWGTIIYNFLMADLISVHQPVTDAIIMIALLWNWSTKPNEKSNKYIVFYLKLTYQNLNRALPSRNCYIKAPDKCWNSIYVFDRWGEYLQTQ